MELTNSIIFIVVAIASLSSFLASFYNYKVNNKNIKLYLWYLYAGIFFTAGLAIYWLFSSDCIVTDGNQKIIPTVEFLIAFIGVVLTFLAFFIQYTFNRTHKNDIQRERVENNLFNFLQTLSQISDDIKVENIGSNKKAFHFIFYQYQGLYFIFYSYLKNHPKSDLFFDKIEESIPLFSFSFLLSGVTNKSNNQIRGKVIESVKYSLYKTEPSLSDSELEAQVSEVVDYFFEDLVNIMLNLQRLTDDSLKVLKNEENLVLFITYAHLIIEKKVDYIDWFWGYRISLVPYIKYLIMTVSYVMESDIEDKVVYYKHIYSQMSEHEIGLLNILANNRFEFEKLVGYHIFVKSGDKNVEKDNNRDKEEEGGEDERSLKLGIITLFNEWLDHTNDLYKIEKWDPNLSNPETLKLISSFAKDPNYELKKNNKYGS